MSANAWAIFATWLGTIASLAGAGIAIWQARRAKAQADRSEALRVTIEGRAVQGDLTEVDTLVTSACNAMSKYGPRGSVAALSGYEPIRDAESVQAVAQALDRHNYSLAIEIGPQCAEIRDGLNAALAEFAGREMPRDHLDTGRPIFLTLTSFSGNIQTALRRRLLAPE